MSASQREKKITLTGHNRKRQRLARVLPKKEWSQAGRGPLLAANNYVAFSTSVPHFILYDHTWIALGSFELFMIFLPLLSLICTSVFAKEVNHYW